MSETNDVNALIRRLRQHALPDPHDEREVLHATLLTKAADEIERLTKEVAYLDAKIESARDALSELV